MGSIFHGYNVVGGVVYCTNDIYGGGNDPPLCSEKHTRRK